MIQQRILGLLGFEEGKHNIRTEVMAGITTFMTMGYPWQFALTAVFIEGLLFVVLTLTNVRSIIVEVLPNNLKTGIGVGIGITDVVLCKHYSQ